MDSDWPQWLEIVVGLLAAAALVTAVAVFG